MDMNMNINQMIKETIKSSKITRLIAQENISVEYSAEATTACFNPGTRTITYPYSMAMGDEDIHMLFIFHEVGHAIFSENTDLFQQGIKNGIATEFNITEDIRIERLIKNKYPGVVKNFVNGYKKLLEKEFFGPVDRINLLSFANRLNIYAKLGPITGKFIKFSDEELKFYNRCASATTEQHAYDLAVELSEMKSQSREEIMKILKDMIDNSEGTSVHKEIEEMSDDSDVDSGQEFDESDDTESHDDEGIYRVDGGDSQEYDEAAIRDIADDIAEFKCNEHFQDKFEQTTIANCSVVSYSSAEQGIVSVYPCDQYTQKLMMTYSYDIKSNSTVNEYVKSLKCSVDAMAKEFESKKAAYRHVNRKVSDTGLLDVNRVVDYKFSDQIFRQRTKIADAKNHGFIIMLDCSGSIANNFAEMTKQVVVLVEFFRKINVKYKVYGYGGTISGHYIEAKLAKKNSLAYSSSYNEFTNEEYLIEFLNSEQKYRDHITNIRGMLNAAGFGFGITPTIDAFSQLEYIANDFFTKNGIQVKKIINITDGQPSDMACIFNYNVGGKNPKKLVVADPVTKKSYMVEPYPYAPIDVMGAIFKDRYDISLASIAIRDRKNSNVKEVFTGLMEKPDDVKSLKDNNFYKVVSSNNNDLFVVKSVDVNPDISDVNISETDSVSAAVTKFKRALIKANKSKNFLNILSQYLSV